MGVQGEFGEAPNSPRFSLREFFFFEELLLLSIFLSFC